MWSFRREFQEFRKENREQHRQVAQSIGELHTRVDQVHGRVNSTRSLIYRTMVGALVFVVMMLLGVVGWAVGKLFE